MKRGLVLTKYLLPAGLLFGAVFILQQANIKPPAAARLRPDNNPDKFHLVGTSSNYDYSITYDPRAADEWLFHHPPWQVNTNLPSK